MYGLIVPPGTPPEVAEALEGTHGNPQIDEMQTRMYLLEHEGTRRLTRCKAGLSCGNISVSIAPHEMH